MDHLLHVDASPRRDTSTSRQLTREFVLRWRAANPGGTVTYRDLAATPVPHLDDFTVRAMFTPLHARTTPQQEALALGESLIAEVEAADAIVIGVPMHNLGIPSVLKAWLDRIVVYGRTIDATTRQGLLGGKRVLIVTARGGAYGLGSGQEHYDFQEPYLRAILGMVGITDVTFIHCELRAAADGDPALAAYQRSAAESLAAAHLAVARHAAPASPSCSMVAPAS